MITCAFENNSPAQLRHMVVNVIVTRSATLDHPAQMLLGLRGTYKGKPMLESGKWGLLGGFVDRDETLEQAVRREVLEESGWELGRLTLFRLDDNPNRPREDRQNICALFFAEATVRSGTTSEETRELRWFNYDEIPFDLLAFGFADYVRDYLNYLHHPFVLPMLGDKKIHIS